MHAATPWLAGFTQRWHIHPNLAETNDRVDGHSNRVAVLVLKFMPDAPVELLRAAVLHDLGEAMVGDISYPVKMANPDILETTEKLEKFALEEMGFKYPDLDPGLVKILNLADRVDAYLWALHHKPHVVASNGKWRAHRDKILAQAMELGLNHLFIEMEQGVQNGTY